MIRKHKKVCATINYIENFLLSVSSVAGCTSISTFASLLGIAMGITNSSIGLKICAIVAAIKNL